MIPLTRLMARQLRAVFSRCLSLLSRGPFPPVLLRADGDGLVIQAQSHGAAIQYHQPGEYPEEEFAICFDVLKQCEGNQPDDVKLEKRNSEVTVRWTDGGIPQTVQVEAESPEAEIPIAPTEMRPNDAGLIAALRDAAATADNEALRYALNCLQLRGQQGRITATDGRQLLIQDGFDFPWEDVLLIPARKVFASRELPADQPVEIGRTEEWVFIRIGLWALHFRIEQQARFPRVEESVPDSNNAATTLNLAETDAEFLAKALKRLPRADGADRLVTVDLNGEIAIRAMNRGDSAPTELVLKNSSRSGDAICFNTDRAFLGRAMNLGFRKIQLSGPEAPALCRDANRHYVWALLGKTGTVEPHDQAARIESPTDPVAASKSEPRPQPRRQPQPHPQPQPGRTPITMPKNNAKSSHANRNGESAAETGSMTALIEQAESVRETLQESLTQTRELIAALKRQKKQARIVESTLASLKRLQSADV